MHKRLSGSMTWIAPVQKTVYYLWDSEREHRSLQSAAKTAAWRMVFLKYAPNEGFDELMAIKHIHDLSCECIGDGYRGEGCPIHDKEYGYFSRLVKRTKQAIRKKWKREGLTGR